MQGRCLMWKLQESNILQGNILELLRGGGFLHITEKDQGDLKDMFVIDLDMRG